MRISDGSSDVCSSDLPSTSQSAGARSPACLATGRASWWADVPASAHAGGVTRRGAVLMTGLTEEVPRVARIQIADVEQHEHVGAIEVAIPIRFAAGFRAKAEKIGRDHV